jgi:hypothetical protein
MFLYLAANLNPSIVSHTWSDAKKCLVTFCLISPAWRHYLPKLVRMTSLHIIKTYANDDAPPWIFNDALPFLRPKNPDRSASAPLPTLLRPSSAPPLPFLRPSSAPLPPLLRPKTKARTVPILVQIIFTSLSNSSLPWAHVSSLNCINYNHFP